MYVMKRNVVMALILSIFTCGLYTIYWMAMMANEMNVLEENRNGISGGAVILFTFLTCGLYGIYYVYRLSIRIYYLFGQLGYHATDNSIINAVLFCASYLIPGTYLVSFAILQNDINHLIDIKYGTTNY